MTSGFGWLVFDKLAFRLFLKLTACLFSSAASFADSDVAIFVSVWLPVK